MVRRMSLPGVAHLPTYRLYRLDGADKIKSAEWIEAHSDEEAVGMARDQTGPMGFELWQQSRLVINSPEGTP